MKTAVQTVPEWIEQIASANPSILQAYMAGYARGWELYGEKIDPPQGAVSNVPACHGTWRPNIIEQKTRAHYFTQPQPQCSNDEELIEDPRYAGTKLSGTQWIKSKKSQ